MSTEQTEPSSHYGDDGHGAAGTPTEAQATEANSATSQPGNAGRRRRRRRKNRGGSQANGAAPATQPAGSEDAGAVAAPVPAAAPQAPQQAPSQNSPQNHAGGKRKNRKRTGGGGGGPAPQPGNGGGRNWQSRSNNGWRKGEPDGNREGARGGFGSEHVPDNIGNGGGRRKGKFGRRGPGTFVGPMDHSYRAVNGNIADGPPSTLDFRSANDNGNGNIRGRNDAQGAEAVVSAVREDAPIRIVCFIEDLFVVAKMQEAARKLGVKVQFAKAEKEVLSALTDAPDGGRPALIVFDLNNVGAKPLVTIPKLKAKLKRGTSIIGFLQHIQGDLKMKAIEAGCDTVMPRSAFSQSVPNLLRRYGFDEAEEMIEA